MPRLARCPDFQSYPRRQPLQRRLQQTFLPHRNLLHRNLLHRWLRLHQFQLQTNRPLRFRRQHRWA